jgi:SAM-dependent methyltransferase
MLSAEELHFNKCKFLSDSFFSSLCPGKTILEVGCFDGHITEVIEQYRPHSLTLLEANKTAVQNVQRRFPYANIIHGDMHKDLSKVGPVDLAIVLGVIYHSHAPLMVLEELVNCCNPCDILIDNLAPAFQWNLETPNVPGMRYTTNDQKTCNILINIDDEIMVTAFENLGYRLVKKLRYPENARAPHLPVFHFTRNTQNAN